MQAMASLWRDSFVRGPCQPSCSGRQHDHTDRRLVRRRRERCVQTHISANASIGPAAPVTTTTNSSSSSPTSTWSMETVDDDWAFESTTVGLSSSKALKINLDLKLYRARLGRMQAALSTDAEAKRQLLRESEASLRACIAMDPADPRSYVVLGKLLMQQKRYDEARKLYADGTTATGNTSPFIWASWGYLETVTGNVSRARKLFDAAIVVDDTHAAAWHKWGMLEMRQGNYLRARDLWTSGIQKCRKVPTRSITYLYCSLAVMAAELGKLSEARAWFQEATRLVEGRSSCALWHAWGMTESRLGDPSAVRYLFKRALQANPRSRYTHLAWALWERRQGNPSACLQLLARGSSLNPADPALYQARGIVEKETRRCDAARTLFQQGLAVDPRHLQLWQAWGVMEYQLGNFSEARRLFQEGVWADPGNKDVVYIFQAWGVLERQAGNAPLARELFKAALKVDPKNEATWSSWIQMEEDLGRLEAANELRIRSSEQQWEFVIPATFSTRSAGASGADSSSSSSSLLQSLMGTLNSFFSVRGSNGGSSGSNGGGRGGWAGAASGRQQLVAELLPPDYRSDLTLSDVMYEAAALEAGSSSSSSNGAATGTDAAGAAVSTSTDGKSLPHAVAQQQQQQAEWSAEAGSSSSSSSGSLGAAGSRVVGGSEQLLDKQQRRDRAAGLQRRPARPLSSNWK